MRGWRVAKDFCNRVFCGDVLPNYLSLRIGDLSGRGPLRRFAPPAGSFNRPGLYRRRAQFIRRKINRREHVQPMRRTGAAPRQATSAQRAWPAFNREQGIVRRSCISVVTPIIGPREMARALGLHTQPLMMPTQPLMMPALGTSSGDPGGLHAVYHASGEVSVTHVRCQCPDCIVPESAESSNEDPLCMLACSPT